MPISIDFFSSGKGTSSQSEPSLYLQISLAKLRLEKINSEIFQLERKFIEHEIRKSRSEEKSKQIKKIP